MSWSVHYELVRVGDPVRHAEIEALDGFDLLAEDDLAAESEEDDEVDEIEGETIASWSIRKGPDPDELAALVGLSVDVSGPGHDGATLVGFAPGRAAEARLAFKRGLGRGLPRRLATLWDRIDDPVAVAREARELLPEVERDLEDDLHFEILGTDDAEAVAIILGAFRKGLRRQVRAGGWLLLIAQAET